MTRKGLKEHSISIMDKKIFNLIFANQRFQFFPLFYFRQRFFIRNSTAVFQWIKDYFKARIRNNFTPVGKIIIRSYLEKGLFWISHKNLHHYRVLTNRLRPSLFIHYKNIFNLRNNFTKHEHIKNTGRK